MKKPKGNQRRHLVNKSVLHRYNGSNIVRHAKKELAIAGYTTNGCGPNKWMYDQVMELIAVFASHGNSGGSAPYEIAMFSRLAKFGIISPLTFKDDEWGESLCPDDDTKQNKRCSHIFKAADGDIYDIDAYNVMYTEQYLFGAKEWTENKTGVTWSGGFICEIDENDICTGRVFKRCHLWSHDIMKGEYVPKDKITLKCKEV